MSTEEKVFFRQAIRRALDEEMRRDERVLVMGQDVAGYGGSYGECEGLCERYGSSRVRNTPVAEAAITGIAVGAAAAGLRPVAFITSMDFVMLALDPLVNYGAKLAYKTGRQLQAPLVLKATAGARGQGPCHAQSLESWLMSVPGLKVVAPSNARDAYGLLKSAIRDPGPVVFIDHKRLFPTTGNVPVNVPLDEQLVPIGKAAVCREGADVTLVSHSYMCTVCLDAAEALAADGISAEVVDLRSLAPLDFGAVMSSANRTGSVVTVEEGQLVCGVGAELGVRLLQALPEVRVARVGAARVPIASARPLEAYAIPDEAAVVAAVRALLRGGA